MRQRDIERVMAAAWRVSEAAPGVERAAAMLDLQRALAAVDPHGVYKL